MSALSVAYERCPFLAQVAAAAWQPQFEIPSSSPSWPSSGTQSRTAAMVQVYERTGGLMRSEEVLFRLRRRSSQALAAGPLDHRPARRQLRVAGRPAGADVPVRPRRHVDPAGSCRRAGRALGHLRRVGACHLVRGAERLAAWPDPGRRAPGRSAGGARRGTRRPVRRPRLARGESA